MKTKILSLYKYWIYADKMKLLFRKELKNKKEEILYEPKSEIEAKLKFELQLTSELGIFKSFWYSSLYTVIEGYKDLKLSIPEIDQLINEEYISTLRLFRNNVYHYQKNTLNPKQLGVDQSDGFVEWIYQIHHKLGDHIMKYGMNLFSYESQKQIRANLKSVLGEDALKIFEK